jgi:hypothetical protein
MNNWGVLCDTLCMNKVKQIIELLCAICSVSALKLYIGILYIV